MIHHGNGKNKQPSLHLNPVEPEIWMHANVDPDIYL